MDKIVQWIMAFLLINLIDYENIPVLAVRLRDKIYIPLNGASCFRRLNGTHQVGCSSTQAGSVGVLHLIKTPLDLEFILNNPPAPPYAPMLPPHLFTRENVLRLRDEGSQNVSVILLLDHDNRMTNFSHELKCPNQYASIIMSNSSQTPTCSRARVGDTWNPWGTGLLYEDLPFPVYYIDDNSEIQSLIDCFEKFNNHDYSTYSQRSLCAVEVNTFMSAAQNTEVCIRRTNFINNLGRTRYCDPLEGQNVYGTLYPRKVNTQADIKEKEKFIVVTSRLDTTSMFDGQGLGAMDSLLGFTVLIATAHMLKLILPPQKALKNSNSNVLFILFNGESYDYIGSQRLVFDMKNLAFPPRYTHTSPVTFEDIDFVLDLATFDDISQIKLHMINQFPQAKDLFSKLRYYATSKNYNFTTQFEMAVGNNLPPSSIHSFLRENMSYPACVLNSPPSNHYYHSIYDDSENIKYTYANTSLPFADLMQIKDAHSYFPADSIQMKLRNVSSILAMTLYELLTKNQYNSDKIANPLLIDEFLYCYLISSDCPLFRAASKPNSFPGLPLPPSRYVSVAGSPQESSGWTYRVLGYLLSEKLDNVTKDSCHYYPRHWFAGFTGKGECRLTTQNYSIALSPAFILEDYDWTSGKYSTWTESTWSPFSSRMFLRVSRQHEIFTLLVGCIICVISFFSVYWINAKAEILFEDNDTGASTDALAPPTAH